MVVVVGIAGASCSGKSTITARLVRHLHPTEAILAREPTDNNVLNDLSSGVLSVDGYFKSPDDIASFTGSSRTFKDFDSLEAIDWPALLKALQQRVEAAVRDRLRVFFVEGFLLFQVPEVRAILDIQLFIDIPKDEAWKRRSAREWRALGSTPQPYPREYFDEVVWPHYLHYYSGVLDGTEDVERFDGTLPPDELLEAVLRHVTSALVALEGRGE